MRLAFFISLFCFAIFTFSSSLPPEHESARLLLVVEEAVKTSDWSLAHESLSKMADFQIELPVPFFFYNGWVHFKQEHFEKAQHSLEHYVVKDGPSGAFYNDALRLLTLVERALNNESVKTAGVYSSSELSESGEDTVQLPLLINKGRDAYIQSLKALFLTDSPVQALVMQINSLLNSHLFTGSRIKKSTEKKGVKFQVSIQNNMIVLQEKNYETGFPQLSAKRLEVNGIDPFIRFDCSNRDMVCWLYHPSNSHEKWIFVDYDELVISELSQAITRLIQLLQQK
ncbi:MAG: hypothetical protein ACJAS1_002330 [Oleiphilaceae bacterium]|jgi:hypothetical protein